MHERPERARVDLDKIDVFGVAARWVEVYLVQGRAPAEDDLAREEFVREQLEFRDLDESLTLHLPSSASTVATLPRCPAPSR